MSAGVKPGSGIPLPRTMSTLSKQNLKCQSGGRLASFSSLSSSNNSLATSKELLKEASSRIQYQPQRLTPLKTSLNRTIGSRSAYSSPRVSKKDFPRSKDTLDLSKVPLSQESSVDILTNGNKNWKTNHVHLSSLDNVRNVQSPSSVMQDIQTGKAKDGLPRLKTTNGNLIWGTSLGSQPTTIKPKNKVTTKRPAEKEGIYCKTLHQKTRRNMLKSADHDSLRMAAVAPFRFR